MISSVVLDRWNVLGNDDFLLLSQCLKQVTSESYLLEDSQELKNKPLVPEGESAGHRNACYN